jgi:hypothetical protein
MHPKFKIYVSEIILDSYEYIPTAYVKVYSPTNAQVIVLNKY